MRRVWVVHLAKSNFQTRSGAGVWQTRLFILTEKQKGGNEHEQAGGFSEYYWIPF